MENEVLNHQEIFDKFIRGNSDIRPPETRGAFIYKKELDYKNLSSDEEEKLSRKKFYDSKKSIKNSKDSFYRKASHDESLYKKLPIREESVEIAKRNRNLSYDNGPRWG
jgi:hypothetical protein